MIKIIPNGSRYQGGPSDAEMQRRFKAVSEAMKAQDVDLLITSAADSAQCQYVRYFAKVKLGVFSVVMFDKEQNVSFFGHGGAGSPAYNSELYGVKMKYNENFPIWMSNCCGDHLLNNKLLEIIKKEGYKKVGIIGMQLFPSGTYKFLAEGLPNVKFVDATDMVDRIIVIKSDEELKILEKSVEMHERALDAVPSLIYAGRNERELGMDLYRLSCIAGATEYLANINLCAGRLQGPMYNLQNQTKIIEEGDSINILFEVPNQDGYYADLHRYYAVGNAAPEVLEAVAASYEAQDYMATICKPGADCKEIFELVNEWYAKHGIGQETRMHGHGQGYGLVERPFFDAQETMKLEENMYIALHPTVRLKGCVVAPGDNYAVTKDGVKRLTKWERKVIII